MFCTYSAVGIIITFIYSMTMFVAFMVYDGRSEYHRKHSVLRCTTTRHVNCAGKKVNVKRLTSNCNEASTGVLSRLFNLSINGRDDNYEAQRRPFRGSSIVPETLSTASTASVKSESSAQLALQERTLCLHVLTQTINTTASYPEAPSQAALIFYEKYFAPFLLNRCTQFATLVLLGAYWFGAAMGLKQVTMGFEVTLVNPLQYNNLFSFNTGQISPIQRLLGQSLLRHARCILHHQW